MSTKLEATTALQPQNPPRKKVNALSRGATPPLKLVKYHVKIREANGPLLVASYFPATAIAGAVVSANRRTSLRENDDVIIKPSFG